MVDEIVIMPPISKLTLTVSATHRLPCFAATADRPSFVDDSFAAIIYDGFHRGRHYHFIIVSSIFYIEEKIQALLLLVQEEEAYKADLPYEEVH